ncbi:MAG: putative 2-dehydropantoate 2-reductase [Prevotella sp.]|jgi:2-dehydropantoate 2-reductase|nr:putative 2-dehydropantoate 2-reductase [Prevotella sp.]
MGNHPVKLRYAVVGSGAIGGYYGGMLSRAGKDVHFLFRSDYDEVIKNGFSIDSVNGNFVLNPVAAYRNTADMPPCDVVLVCLKSTGNHLLKTLLPPLLHPRTLVVMIQNGLGLEAALQAEFPSLSIAGGMAFICSNKTAHGRVSHLAYGKLSIGLHTDTGAEILETVVSDFNAAGVEAELVALPVSRWKKLVWNIPYNGMTVVLNATTDKLMRNPHTRKLIYELMLEVIRAGNKVGNGNWTISESFADNMLEMTDSMVPYSPSMKLDFDARRPMEIDCIYAQPVIIARQAGFDMPRTAMLEKQLRFIEAGYLSDSIK